MSGPKVSEERKRALASIAVTLNGEPARISRARDAFAYVVQDESGLGCEWSWKAAERIVAAGGEFRS